MPERFNIHCPSCNVIFDVSEKFCKKTVECTKCGQVFQVPPYEKIKKELEENKARSVEATAKNDTISDDYASSTTKLVRWGKYGMIPPPRKKKKGEGYETKEFAIPPKAAEDAKKKSSN